MWLLLLMIFVMPYEANPYLYIAPSFLGIMQDFTFIKLVGLLGFCWAALQVLAGRVPEGILASRQARTFLLFVLGIVVAGLVSGTGYLPVTRYVAFLLFMPLVLAAVRTHDDLRLVVQAMVLSIVLTFPYAIRQMLRFDARLGVGLYEPNYFAAILVLLIPLALAIASVQAVRGRRALWLLAAGILLASLLLTSSRGGFLGLLVAGALFVYRRRGAGAALALLAGLMLAALPTELGQRALDTLWADVGTPAGLEASNRAHMALFWAALRMIADAPLTGVGPYNFKEVSAEYSGLETGAIAHNTWLELAAEAGLPVLGLFILVLAAAFSGLRRGLHVPRDDREGRELAAWSEGLRSGLVGFLVAGTFISAQYEKWLWLTVFVSIVVERLARQRQVAALRRPAPDPAQPAPAAPGRGALGHPA